MKTVEFNTKTAEGIQTIYEHVHANSRGYTMANHGLAHIDAFCQLAQPCGHVVELGAGNGKTAMTLVKRGLPVTAVDIASNAPGLKLAAEGYTAIRHCAWEPWPEQLRGDWFFTSDFMEHLPPDRVDDVFARLAENIRLGGYMVVSCTPDVTGEKIFGKGHQLHLTVQPVQWWLDKANGYFRYLRNLSLDETRAIIFMRSDQPAI